VVIFVFTANNKYCIHVVSVLQFFKGGGIGFCFLVFVLRLFGGCVGAGSQKARRHLLPDLPANQRIHFENIT
jgi:hypothetical protein